MRYFLGIDLPAKTKLNIQDWRDKSWAQHRELGSVPTANFHITLAFLGHLSEQQFEQLCEQLVLLELSKFKVELDRFNVWQKPPIAWLGCASIDKHLLQLQAAITRSARIAGISIMEREYIPHVTLARKCKELVSAPLLEPKFNFNVEHFGLFESVSTSSGVTYPIRERWSLS